MASKQPVNNEFDAMLGEEYSLEASSPDYVVESGYTIGDSIILSAEVLTLTLFVSDRPVTFKSRFGGAGRVDSVVKQLKELYYAKKLVSVTTPDAQYSNMAIESLKISRTNEYGYAREIPITLKHIRTTETQTTSIPASYGKSGSSNAAAGTASPVRASPGLRQQASPPGSPVPTRPVLQRLRSPRSRSVGRARTALCGSRTARYGQRTR